MAHEGKGERLPKMGVVHPRGDRGQERKGKRAYLGLVHNTTETALKKAALRRVASCLCVDFSCLITGFAQREVPVHKAGGLMGNVVTNTSDASWVLLLTHVTHACCVLI